MIDPETKPREFLILVLAVGLKIFGNKPWSHKQHFEEATGFVEEAERQVGKLNP